MNCVFLRSEEYLVCQNCGRQIKTTQHFDKLHRKCNFVPQKEYPSLLQMTKNAINAGIDFIKDGGQTVDEEEQKRRISICTGNAEAGIPACPAYDKEQNRCRECGCFLNWATTVNSKHCPLNKW